MFIVFKKGNVKASERIVSVKRNRQELVKISETDAKSATGDVSQVPPLDLVNREISQNGTYEIKTTDEKSRQVAVTDLPALQEIKGPWEVKFVPGLGAPERIVLDDLPSWSRHSDSGVRYFSGLATYRKLFELPKSQINSGKAEVGNLKSKMYLDLGKVAVMAEVKLNGKNLGITIGGADAHGGFLQMLSASQGIALGGQQLKASPVWDGLAVSAGRLYVSLENGTVVCFDDK